MVATHCIPTGSLGTKELAVPHVGPSVNAEFAPAAGPFRGIAVNLHGLAVKSPAGMPLTIASDTVLGANNEFITGLNADGWRVIMPAFQEDFAAGNPPVAVQADIDNDSGHGSRYVFSTIRWWDHMVEYINRVYPGYPILVVGGSWGGWRGMQIAANRPSTIIGYAVHIPATILSNVPIAFTGQADFSTSNTTGWNAGIHLLDNCPVLGLISYGEKDGAAGWGIPGVGTCPNDGSYTYPLANTDQIIINAQAAGRPVTRRAVVNGLHLFQSADSTALLSWITANVDPLAPKTLGPETFFDDWETGNNSKWPTVTGAPPVSAASALTGSFGVRLSPANSDKSLGCSTTKWIQSNRPYFSFVGRFRMNTLPAGGSTASLFTIQNLLQVANVDFFVEQATGRFFMDLQGPIEVLDTGITPVVGTWYTVQIRAFFGAATWWADLMINGTPFTRLESPGHTPSSTRTLRVGPVGLTNQTWQADLDNIKIVVDSKDPGWIT